MDQGTPGKTNSKLKHSTQSLRTVFHSLNQMPKHQPRQSKSKSELSLVAGNSSERRRRRQRSRRRKQNRKSKKQTKAGVTESIGTPVVAGTIKTNAVNIGPVASRSTSSLRLDKMKTDPTSDLCRLKIPELKRDIREELEAMEKSRRLNQLQSDPIQSIADNRMVLERGYRILRLIGSGSYAHVFKAVMLKNPVGEEVALKLIELKKCTEHYRRNFLKNEVRIIRKLNRLQHVNIVGFVEAFNIKQPCAYVMVMEYIENGTLSELICHQGAMKELDAKRVFRGIASGVSHMHDSNIAHRDLKLENILLTKNLIPKVCDFSLSICWDRKNLSTEWCGTPPFFAPEIYQKKPYDPLAYDVYSCGICLFIMTNNTLPFYGDEDRVILQRQLNRDFRFREKFRPSYEMKMLITEMLEPDFVHRITIKQVLQSTWFSNCDSDSSLVANTCSNVEG